MPQDLGKRQRRKVNYLESTRANKVRAPARSACMLGHDAPARRSWCAIADLALRQRTVGISACAAADSGHSAASRPCTSTWERTCNGSGLSWHMHSSVMIRWMRHLPDSPVVRCVQVKARTGAGGSKGSKSGDSSSAASDKDASVDEAALAGDKRRRLQFLRRGRHRRDGSAAPAGGHSPLPALEGRSRLPDKAISMTERIYSAI